MKVNIERDIDVKQLLINLDSKSQCKRVGMAGYEVTVDKQMLRDAHDVIAQFMKEREEKTLVFAELENGTKTSGYYTTEEAGKALKKTIEEVNKSKTKSEGALKQDCFGCHVNGDRKCSLCVYERKCMIETEKVDKKSCFGNYQDVYMCTHCIDYEKCREETDKTKQSKYKNCTVNSKGVAEHLQQKCDECFYKDYELCKCTHNSGEGFCPFRPLCFMNYERDNVLKCCTCDFKEECAWKRDTMKMGKTNIKEPKLKKDWEEIEKYSEKCYSRYKAMKEKQDRTCGIIFNEEDTCCTWCDEYDNCLKESRRNEQKKH